MGHTPAIEPEGRSGIDLPSTCSDCGGAMVAGFIVDTGYGMEVVSTWQEGEPKKKWWAFGGVARLGAARMEVTTLRCGSCGVLKDYALDKRPAA